MKDTNINDKLNKIEYLYHNTEKLLKKYRGIVWSVEVVTIQCEEDLIVYRIDFKTGHFLCYCLNVDILSNM